MGLTTFSGSQPTLKEAVVAKNYLNEKELRAMGQLVSGYLDFAERQAEREQAMTMQDWSLHLKSKLGWRRCDEKRKDKSLYLHAGVYRHAD